jgi:hypothetical protein
MGLNTPLGKGWGEHCLHVATLREDVPNRARPSRRIHADEPCDRFQARLRPPTLTPLPLHFARHRVKGNLNFKHFTGSRCTYARAFP